jgi:hypothetical protein
MLRLVKKLHGRDWKIGQVTVLCAVVWTNFQMQKKLSAKVSVVEAISHLIHTKYQPLDAITPKRMENKSAW